MSIMSEARSHRQAFEMGVMDEWANKMPTGIMEGEYAEAYLSGYNLCDRWKGKTAFSHHIINLVGECFANGYVDGHTAKPCDQSARDPLFNEAMRAGHIIGQSIRVAKAQSHNPNCDGDKCERTEGPVKLLPKDEESNAILCHACFLHEMEWRKQVNEEEGGTPPTFIIHKWEDLKVYGAE